jgi:hypothetical protein
MSGPPLFKVRKSAPRIYLGGGDYLGDQTEAIDGFASEKAATAWIAKVREILASGIMTLA